MVASPFCCPLYQAGRKKQTIDRPTAIAGSEAKRNVGAAGEREIVYNSFKISRLSQEQTMTLDGHVENGSIVLDETATLPEGAKVRIEVLPAECPIASEPSIPTLYERLRNVVGKAKGQPADAAINHDHYLFGHPKK
jgi:hypothetical protein